MKFFSSLVSTVLIPLIAVPPIRAQLPPPSSGAEATLQVRVLESSGSRFLVEVTAGAAAPIGDWAAAPVAGAAVAFRLPDTDPIGTFADGSHAAVVYTDTNGRARVEGIHWNRTSGSATVRITAAKGGAHAGLILDQAISTSVVQVPVAKTVPQPGVLKPVQTKIATPPAPVARSGASAPAAQEPPHVSVTSASPGEASHSSSKKWLVIALLAGAARAGAAFAMKGKSSSPAAPAPSLSIGNPSISIGHP
ncbi:MAG TPA: hypothetical protein VH369_04040 [Bryobacteraceae bacterium]